VLAIVGSQGWQAPPSSPQADTDGVVHIPFEQHPFAQDVASHTQPLTVQRWPGWHASPPLQEHCPDAEQSLPVSPQDEQVAPSTPQAGPDGGDVQALFEQHPSGQEVPSQVQPPVVHRWPCTQAAPPLQVHAPCAEHPLPLVPQTVHPPPSTPHASTDAAMHTLSEQHPSGQDAASHVQTPPTHSSPAPHASPEPQTHVPAIEQSFAFDMHVTHAPPLAPHARAVGVVHVEPEQHPFGHVSSHPAHAPPLQTSSEGQPLHIPPPVPHMPCALPGSQVEPLQHPLQVVPSQTQAPPEQCCPVEHGAPPPHVHEPADEQPSPVPPHGWHVEPWVPQAGPVAGEVHTLPVQHPVGHDAELQTHMPFKHVCPTAQAGPAPQLQAPEGEQVLASLMLHGTQAMPSVPQLPNDEAVHVFPLQHPPGHEAELQRHCPPTQVCPASHGPEEPQLHAPAVEQLFELDATQATQATPATPQVANVEVSHVAPAQQPKGQLKIVQPVQVPASLQSCSDGHAVHPEPPEPHIPLVLPGSHVLPAQHPLGHEVPLHTHVPARQT
jgi:hypothetical protein